MLSNILQDKGQIVCFPTLKKAESSQFFFSVVIINSDNR